MLPLREREADLASALATAEALERELSGVGDVMRKREADLAAVQAAAAAQAEAARSALKDSQRKVGRRGTALCC